MRRLFVNVQYWIPMLYVDVSAWFFETPSTLKRATDEFFKVGLSTVSELWPLIRVKSRTE